MHMVVALNDVPDKWQAPPPPVYKSQIATPSALTRSFYPSSPLNNAPPVKQTEILAVSTEGDDIWAGGTAGTLFHSTDNGVHWRQIPVSDGTTQLTDSILQITRAGQQLLLKTPSETWTSSAPHAHWHKQ